MRKKMKIKDCRDCFYLSIKHNYPSRSMFYKCLYLVLKFNKKGKGISIYELPECPKGEED